MVGATVVATPEVDVGDVVAEEAGAKLVRRLPALTRTLDDRSSIVSRFIRSQFPNTRHVRSRYLAAAPALGVSGGGGNAGTVGAAFDWRLRFLVDPRPILRLAELGAQRTGLAGLVVAVEELTVELDATSGPGAAPRERSAGPPTPAVEMAAAVPDRDDTRLLRACWALALLTEVYRAGRMFPGSPLAALDNKADAEALLALAPRSALDELAGLTDVAQASLLPAVRERGAPIYVGPVFAGSRLMSADADLIVGGMLLEVKTTLGDKRSDGSRRCVLETETVYQSLGYVLLDFDDAYRIDTIAVYAARYGYLATWPLAELLDELAGEGVDLARLRDQFRALLTSEVFHPRV